MVWQSPRLGFVAEAGRFVAMETPRVRFSALLLCLASYFSFFVFFSFSYFFSLHPGMFIFFASLRLRSSHLLLSLQVTIKTNLLAELLSASTYLIVRGFSACVICSLPHLGFLLFFIRSVFFVGLISRVAFFLLCFRTRYAST